MATTIEPSDDVLEKTPVRAIKVLNAASTNAQIFATLATRGYSDVEHERGWNLLLAATGYRIPRPPVLEQPKSRAAIAELDAWDEPNFRVARAALQIDFPEQHDFIFDNLEPATGAGAVVSITTFLDRLDALESGKGRKATHKQDHAALAKLAARGITSDERKRLRGLLAIALVAPDAPAETPPPAPLTTPQRREALRALWGWMNEWSEVAKAVIKRRDHLINMGLAKRKSRGEGGGGKKKSRKKASEDAAPPAPTPVAKPAKPVEEDETA
jgi:hypothetical protein